VIKNHFSLFKRGGVLDQKNSSLVNGSLDYDTPNAKIGGRI